jgi:DNA-binding HxlR family transcriptional regulator
MPASVYERLQLGVAILNALENRRARTGDDMLHRDLEQRIIQRELDELERESMAHKQARTEPG